MNILDEIDRVFRLEITALTEICDGLDDSYAQAARLISQITGKVVVTGLGKSGLIAQKIAATMVSTGTPATFLHAADGMHGDVGLVQKDDLVLAISKSGETEELLGILLYIKNAGVPVVCITANRESPLASNSDIVLFTPIKEEACPLDLAPTSSTTAALVVGDALAMALMKMRDFTPDNFAMYHPGGRLGRQLLLTVKDSMRAGEDNPAINVNETVAHMLYQISSKRCGAVSVVDDGNNLLGLVTDFDVRKSLETSPDIFAMGISEIMNTNPTHTFSDELAIKAKNMMGDRPIPFLVLPVLDRDSGVVVGMVHIHDLVAKGL